MLVDASKGNTCWLETKSATFASRFSPPRLLPLPLSDHSASQMRRDLRNFFNSAPQRDFRPSCNIVREFSSIDFEPPRHHFPRSIATLSRRVCTRIDRRRIAPKNDFTFAYPRIYKCVGILKYGIFPRGEKNPSRGSRVSPHFPEFFHG